MKKISFLSLGLIVTSLFAQDTAVPNISNIASSGSTENFWITILKYGFLYFVLPILLYCISSYSLGLLDKHYHKKTSSQISWVPFARYYSFIQKITKSSKKAFIITLLPWIITLGSVGSFVILGIIDSRFFPEVNSSIYTAMTVAAILTLVGAVTIVTMSFWRAFIISKYVKGDTTTTLGLSIYTAPVLWYIALDRVYKKTDIFGIVGFSFLGLIICFLIAIFIMLGLDGVIAFLRA